MSRPTFLRHRSADDVHERGAYSFTHAEIRIIVEKLFGIKFVFICS